jgi:hypothetical protein
MPRSYSYNRAVALAELDTVWIECAHALDLPVARGGQAYVHFDGATLHVADGAHLDADDSLAQLILHEICHALVQGPGRRHLADWGLDNTGGPDTSADEVRERAAVRLQAHLATAFGLRELFFPTTVVRPFYEGLSAHPLDEPDGDGSVALARAAATRAGHAPYRGAISTALRRSAELLARSLHRGGAALDHSTTCGGCAWREPSGLCRAADRRVFVATDEAGCARREAALDCLSCGACCRSGYDTVPAGPRSTMARLHPELVVAHGADFDLRRVAVEDEDRCAALAGPLAGPYACIAYADRPSACADLPAGGRACLEARRRVGLSFA